MTPCTVGVCYVETPCTVVVCYVEPAKHVDGLFVCCPGNIVTICEPIHMIHADTRTKTVTLPNNFGLADLLIVLARIHNLKNPDNIELRFDGLPGVYTVNTIGRDDYPIVEYNPTNCDVSYRIVPNVRVSVTPLTDGTKEHTFPAHVSVGHVMQHMSKFTGVLAQTCKYIREVDNTTDNTTDPTVEYDANSNVQLSTFGGTHVSFVCIVTPVTLALHWVHEFEPDDDVVPGASDGIDIGYNGRPNKVELWQNPRHLSDSVKNAMYDRLRGKYDAVQSGQVHICDLHMVDVHVTDVTQTGYPPDQVNCDLEDLAHGGTTWAGIFPWITGNSVIHVSMYFYDLIERSLDTNLPNTRVDGVVYIYRSDSFLGVSNSQPYITNHDTDYDTDGEFGNEDDDVLHLVASRGVLLKRNEFKTWTWVWKKSYTGLE